MKRVIRNNKIISVVAVMVLVAAVLTSGVVASAPTGSGDPPVGSGINYQGQLTDSGGLNADGPADIDEDGIPDDEEENGHVSDLDGEIYFTDNRSESTDRDPYDDGMEIDGHSPADLGDFGGQMPARVEAPGKHPLVPSYPDLEVYLEGMDVVAKCTITSTETKREGSSWTLETETTKRTKVKGKVGGSVSPIPPFVSVSASVSIAREWTVRTLASTSGWSEEEWSTATAVQPHDAAKLKLHIKIRNDGTDLAQNVKLTFNVKIGDKVVDTVWTGETPIAGLIEPGEVYPPVDYILVDSDKDGRDIAVTLDELKSIELGAPISIQMIETIAEVPWGKAYRDWAPYISDIEEVSARIMFDFGEGNVKDYRVWSGIRYLPAPPWEEYIMDVTLGDAMDWMVGLEEKDDGIYIGGVRVEEWGFGFFHDTYEHVVEELGPDWNLYDLLNLTIKQGWTIVVKVPDTEPPDIHWAGYTADMKTIRASVSDNEIVTEVIAHVKVGDSYEDIPLEDDDGDLIFTATLEEEIVDTYGDYVIASDEKLVTIWNDIRVMPDWWRMFGHDASHTGSSYSTAPDSSNVLWSRVVERPANSLAVADGKVFVASNDFNIYCLDADNGNNKIWSYRTFRPVRSSPAVADGKVFVGSGVILNEPGRVYCLDEDTGDKIWSYEVGDAVVSSPAVADGRVFVGSYDRNIYCFDVDDKDMDGKGDLIWSYPTLGEVYSSPAVVDGKVFVGCGGFYETGRVYCLDEDNGNKIWRYDFGEGVYSSSPAVADGKVFVGSSDNNIYCLDVEDEDGDRKGDLIWSYPTGGSVVSTPAVVDGKVFVGSGDGKVYCLDEDTGDMIWTGRGGSSSSPAVADGKVFTGGIDENIYCLSEDTGGLIWSYQTGQTVRSPAVADGKVFVASYHANDGRVYCFASLPLLPPTASIDSISPDPAEQEKDTVEFRGQGSDPNGSVVAYQWESYIDGFLSDEEDFDRPASELSPGTHTIFFMVKDNDGLWSTQDIGYVKIVAPAGSTIGFSPAELNFSASEGGANPAAQTLEIWNSGAGTLDWSVSDGADWLSLSPPGGSSTGERDAVTISVDISGKSAGNYPATITISAPGAANTPQTVPVTLQINVPGSTVTWPLPWGLDADPASVNIWTYPGDAVAVTLADVDSSMPPGLLIWYYGGPTQGWRFYKKGWGAVNTLEMLVPGNGYIGIVPTAGVWEIPQD
jgi:outer membrane protein assembly factor BamB